MNTVETEHTSVHVEAVGDLLLCGRYDAIAEAGLADSILARLPERPNTFRVGNLECPLADGGEPRDDKLCLRGNPAYARSLAQAGFGLVSLANNHTFDYGPEAFEQTASALEASGVGFLGAGSDLDAARQPVILEREGRRIGFLAACHPSTKPSDMAGESQFGVAPLEPATLLADIAHWRNRVDHLLLLLHWGLEYSPLPTPDQVEVAHAAVDAGAGAGLIIGHHSHMLQGIEEYKGVVIAYSLGNCTDSDVDWQGPTRLFEARMTETDRQGLLLTAELTSTGSRVIDRVPLWLNEEGQPVPAGGERASTILAQLDERSAALNADDLSRQWEDKLVDKRVIGPLRHWGSRGSLWDKVRAFRPSQLKKFYLLITTFVRIRLSRSESRWGLFNPRNDTRPMPYAGDEQERDGQ
jgi:poly-gamma-glutamate synthesis protein (capsule biosynthesis protein)